jgi:hypothetical protein
MVKSTISLSDGTIITVEGSTKEVERILDLYVTKNVKSSNQEKVAPHKHVTERSENINSDKIGALSLVNAMKNSSDFDEIEKKILDTASQVDRVLLPLYILDKEFVGGASLTSNDVYKFLKEFGISMALPNISKTLGKTAAKYVIADSTRRKGASTGYKISRKGRQYVEQILGK